MTKPLKVVLLGDPGTGKTNLLSRFTKNHFNPKYEPSAGVMVSSYDIHLAFQIVEADLWDFAGEEKYRCLTNSGLVDADGVLLVYDVSNPATFEHLGAWLRHIRQAASRKTVIKLVGNKNDLQGMVLRKEAEQFAADNNLSYIETSALNDSHVHLAFESIAQEIDVATHSVSEPPFSSVQKESKASSDADDQQEKPFQVVLIDIEQAADRKIVCVEKPLEDVDFIAISYRWGEVHEQVIDTNLGYVARVTSFDLDDFYQLCQDINREVDLGSIKYVWVDAICVDQMNHAHRKATIYQMSNIYHRAAYILAVPDLHFQYLRNNQILDTELHVSTFKLRDFIYYLLQEKTDQLVQITEEWFDEMKIPKGKAREELTSCYPDERFTHYLDVYNEQDPDSSCRSPCIHNCYNDRLRGNYNKCKGDCHDTPETMLGYLQYSINKIHSHSENTIMVYENSECALCSLQMEMCKHQKTLDKNVAIPDSDQKWLACVLREIRYDKYRGIVADRANAVANVMDYLGYLIKDWSSRVWVISEVNIAKTKQSRKLKIWFLSLRFLARGDIENTGFFVFDFDKMKANGLFPGDCCSYNCVITGANSSYRNFQKTLISQLNERSFLEMMLASKASRNEDRFYAIFPSSEYKTKLTSREVVSSWQIDTIGSVKLKLFEVMTTRDRLHLLFWMASGYFESNCTLPAFANMALGGEMIPPIKERNEENHPCNFDLNNDATLRLVLPMENGSHFYKLNLSPKMYYVLRPDERSSYGDQKFVDDKKRFWKALEINCVDDDLVYVKIPMYMHYIDKDYEPKGIVLLGSFKKNKWLLCQTLNANVVIKRLSFKDYDNSEGNISFDIY